MPTEIQYDILLQNWPRGGNVLYRQKKHTQGQMLREK